MAHYASDCWDFEVLTSVGWIECVGHADRAAYDLTAHIKGSGHKLMAQRVFDKPVEKKIMKYNLNNKLIGKTFKHNSKKIIEDLKCYTFEKLVLLEKDLK